MTVALFTFGFVGLFFVLMSVRLLFLKNGQFKGTCASQNPFLKKEGGTCGYCGKNLDKESSCGKSEEDMDDLGPVEKVLASKP